MRTMLPGSRCRSALLHNTLQWAGQPQGRSYFRCVIIPWHPSAPGGLVARCCAYNFSDAGVCRTPREKPHDRTPTNRLTNARTKSRSLASAAAPASASMAARCAIQILWTNPGLAISGRRGNGSAGVSIYITASHKQRSQGVDFRVRHAHFGEKQVGGSFP